MRVVPAVAPRRLARGETHAGVIAVGVIAALAAAWWLARADAVLGPGAMTDPASPVAQPVAAAPAIPAGRESTDNTGNEHKPLYRWSDASGVVHFTDVPPKDRPYVEADVHPDRNVVRTPAPPELPEP